MKHWFSKNMSVAMLAFISFQAQAGSTPKVYDLTKYGIVPNTGQNSSATIQQAIQKVVTEAGKTNPIVIKFKKGRYDFHAEGAQKKVYYISNHDQDNPKTVGLALEHMDNVTIDGQGSDFIFHGRMLPISLIENQNVSLKNIHIDFEQPQICQVKILENDVAAGVITYQTAPWVTYAIKDSTFYNTGEGWEMKPTSGIAFEEKTKHIVYNTSDISVGTSRVTEVSKGIIKAPWKNEKLIPGTVVAMRSWHRPNPGIFVHKGKNTRLENISVHYSEGMGLLAQLTEDIYLEKFNVSMRGKNDPRYFTAQADATHFSGCKGVIVSNNGLYENMMDDAINIHGTYLKIIKKIDDHTLLARYMQEQSFGFDWGYVGDSVQFIQSKTMELWDNKNSIQTIKVIREKESDPIMDFEIKFSKALDAYIDPTQLDIGIENLTWTPAVEFKGNTVRNNRARGALFSTPQKTVVENNLFDHTSGTAILLCGDSNGWYETGSCRDITIKNNKFINALTNMFQFTNAVISIYPEIPDLKNQKKYFHSGIKIENNYFETFDKPILYAKSVDGITFRNNKIKTNKEYPAFHWNKNAILFERVVNTDIDNNTIDGKPLEQAFHAEIKK
ncbi:right-handed parallel beta-helix repeat-containing protein [Sphingobacterium faecium]|uniref:right-handed parallel beta-helix repeat-containing protein n=1 Tax=Sphingobacterium faecium TaxID=34087 RepID=UPI0024684474|nr:right-handed parallel beta-helix repeat-containing protein [Sphingobacterium faecium]MDH5826324.1 right-handed parallel beta-helix repeat-containing protein [Sphingobacterium faecium]